MDDRQSKLEHLRRCCQEFDSLSRELKTIDYMRFPDPDDLRNYDPFPDFYEDYCKKVRQIHKHGRKRKIAIQKLRETELSPNENRFLDLMDEIAQLRQELQIWEYFDEENDFIE